MRPSLEDGFLDYRETGEKLWWRETQGCRSIDGLPQPTLGAGALPTEVWGCVPGLWSAARGQHANIPIYRT